MKKLLFGFAVLSLMVSCSGKPATNQDTTEDTSDISDSVSQVETFDTVAENSPIESVQDSLNQMDIAQEKEDKNEIKKTLKKFYEGAVIGYKGGISWTKSSLSKYCTESFLRELKKSNDYDDGGYAVWILRNPDIQDSDGRDKVISVDVDNDNNAVVTYLDCGYTSKTKLFMVKEGNQWKINDCKFISGSSKSKYSEYNW